MMVFKQIVEWGNKHPRKLFLIDGLGAILSAFLLGIVLVALERFFGIPQFTLYFLALIPCLFAIYDIYCYLIKDENIGGLLKRIALMNIAYTILSFGVAIYHSQKITYLGWSYLILEILIVIALAKIELKVAARLILNKQASAIN